MGNASSSDVATYLVVSTQQIRMDALSQVIARSHELSESLSIALDEPHGIAAGPRPTAPASAAGPRNVQRGNPGTSGLRPSTVAIERSMAAVVTHPWAPFKCAHAIRAIERHHQEKLTELFRMPFEDESPEPSSRSHVNFRYLDQG